MTKNIDRILEMYPEENFIQADGFDDAIIGVEQNSKRIIYDIDIMTTILMVVDDMSREDAIEHLEYNVIGAYVGEQTPIYINKIK